MAASSSVDGIGGVFVGVRRREWSLNVETVEVLVVEVPEVLVGVELSPRPSVSPVSSSPPAVSSRSRAVDRRPARRVRAGL